MQTLFESMGCCCIMMLADMSIYDDQLWVTCVSQFHLFEIDCVCCSGLREFGEYSIYRPDHLPPDPPAFRRNPQEEKAGIWVENNNYSMHQRAQPTLNSKIWWYQPMFLKGARIVPLQFQPNVKGCLGAKSAQQVISHIWIREGCKLYTICRHIQTPISRYEVEVDNHTKVSYDVLPYMLPPSMQIWWSHMSTPQIISYMWWRRWAPIWAPCQSA